MGEPVDLAEAWLDATAWLAKTAEDEEEEDEIELSLCEKLLSRSIAEVISKGVVDRSTDDLGVHGIGDLGVADAVEVGGGRRTTFEEDCTEGSSSSSDPSSSKHKVPSPGIG